MHYVRNIHVEMFICRDTKFKVKATVSGKNTVMGEVTYQLYQILPNLKKIVKNKAEKIQP